MVSLLEMPEEYAPPPEIYHHPERLKEHFEAIHRRSAGPGADPIEHDPSIDVSAATQYRRKMGLPPA